MPQLFINQHYAAFQPPKPFDDGPQERLERERVRDQLLWLDTALSPFIVEKGWDIYPHHQSMHRTSSTHFIWINTGTGEVDDKEGPVGRWQPIVKEIHWLWLHYGKSKDQLNVYKDQGVRHIDPKNRMDFSNAFYVHARIQFYLTKDYFGVYLLFTDRDLYDKKQFLDKLRKSSGFEALYWKQIQSLFGKGFQYVVEDDTLPLVSGLDPKELFNFIRTSRKDCYSGIQKRYQPDDPRIQIENIVEEMKLNLELLYPLYDLMACRQNVPLPPPDLSKLFGGTARVRNRQEKA